jgi:hypothetical protein
MTAPGGGGSGSVVGQTIAGANGQVKFVYH